MVHQFGKLQVSYIARVMDMNLTYDTHTQTGAKIRYNLQATVGTFLLPSTHRIDSLPTASSPEPNPEPLDTAGQGPLCLEYGAL